MSRLIDADAIRKRYKHELSRTYLDDYAKGFQAGLNAATGEHAPVIDAVAVVRCKDCRWWDKSEDSPFGYCMAMKHGYMSTNWEIGIYRRYKGDFYCADAERREDE